MSDLHSSCILFSPPKRASQQASIAPSGVGQHSPSMPIAAQPVIGHERDVRVRTGKVVENDRGWVERRMIKRGIGGEKVGGGGSRSRMSMIGHQMQKRMKRDKG